ncbi:MAG: sporulation protein [Lachnospiraceae bacterium]|nr:sporulation protein [Lachnospiraceae bacterium]
MIPALLLYMLLFPKKVLADSLAGLDLWFHTVLPSLLPFMILSNVLIGANVVSQLMRPFSGFFRHVLGLSPEGGYAWLLGLFCGFPMGARLTGDMYRQHRISREEAGYLLTFANQSSPMFLSTYVVLHGLGDSTMTLPVFVIFYASAFLTSLVFRIRSRRFGLPPSKPKKEVPEQTSYGNLLDTSIMNGFEIITRLGGYIILFSILAGIVLQLPAPLHTAAPFLSGLTEITTGIHTISGTTLPLQVKFTAIVCCTAFGGFSTVAQTSCMLNGTGLSIFTYLKGKLVNAAVAGLLCLFVFVVFI